MDESNDRGLDKLTGASTRSSAAAWDGDRLEGEDNESGLAADWAVPWSDLMMVMFILFVVLFAYQMAERDIRAAVDPGERHRPDVAPEASRDGAAPESAERLFRRTREAIRDTNIEDIEVELQADDSIKLSLRGPLFFDVGTADLRAPTRDFLDRVAVVLHSNDYRVRVLGHTDSFPVSNARFPTNWELSAVRATTVTRYLIERGLEPGRFTVVGHSMYRPVASNTSGDDRAMNRRVEIVITREHHGRPAGGIS